VRGGHSYREFGVPRELSGLVSSVWLQTVADDAGEREHRSVPAGGVELTCVVGQPPLVLGPRTRTSQAVLAPGTTLAGIRLRPAAGAAVLGLPPGELTDCAAEASAIFGRHAATRPENGAEALDLLRRLVTLRDAAPEPMMTAALRAHGPWRVGDASSGLELSDRQFRRRCLAACGLPPKTLLRILRFQVFLALAQRDLASGGDPLRTGLANLAVLAGYADQPHLTRECLRLAGRTPRDFVRQVARSCDDEHDHRASIGSTLRMSGLINN
jgi:AraC-like DNA-binding protein